MSYGPPPQPAPYGPPPGPAPYGPPPGPAPMGPPPMAPGPAPPMGPPPAEKPKKETKGIIAMVFGIIAVVMIGIAFIGPWYTMKMSMTVMETTMESSGEYKLREVTAKSPLGTMTVSYSDKAFDTEEGKKVRGVFDTTFYLWIVGLILAILGIVFAALGGMAKKLKPKLAAIIVIVAFVLALLAPIYFMGSGKGTLDDMIKKQAGGGNATAGAELTTALGYANYLHLVGAIFLLIGAIMLFLIKVEPPAPTPIAPMPAPMAPGPAPYQPPPAGPPPAYGPPPGPAPYQPPPQPGYGPPPRY